MSEKEHSNTSQQSNMKESNISFKMRAYGIIRHLLVGFIIASVANGAFSYIFYTPKAYSIEVKNRQLIQKFQLLQERIEAAELHLAEISHRDNYIYRPLFSLDTVRPPLTATNIKVQDNHNSLLADLDNAVIRESNNAMSIMANNLYNQSISFDELQALAKDKEKLANAIPAVWPIDRTLLKSGGRGFGMKMHPIYKRYIMHKGVDLPGTTGDPIYATADGVVKKSEQGYRTKGYGQTITIDHGFGYQTLYGHMSKRYAFVGDSIKRGDVIGLMGSTGGSTGPHLHYEVIIRGESVDPVNFFNRSMSKEEYQQLKEQMAASEMFYEIHDF